MVVHVHFAILRARRLFFVQYRPDSFWTSAAVLPTAKHSESTISYHWHHLRIPS